MIAGLSKAVILYLTPVLLLTALLLSLFAYLAPVIMLHGQVALLTVTPSMSLTQPESSQGIDGPSLFLGMLGELNRPIPLLHVLKTHKGHARNQIMPAMLAVLYPRCRLRIVSVVIFFRSL